MLSTPTFSCGTFQTRPEGETAPRELPGAASRHVPRGLTVLLEEEMVFSFSFQVNAEASKRSS